jgi:hypothetical protein
MNRRDMYLWGAIGLVGMKCWNDFYFYGYSENINKKLMEKIDKIYRIIHSPYYLHSFPRVYNRMNDLILKYTEKDCRFDLKRIYHLCYDVKEIENLIRRVDYASSRLLSIWNSTGNKINYLERDRNEVREKRYDIEGSRDNYRMKIPILYIESFPFMNFIIDFSLVYFLTYIKYRELQ